MTTKEQFSPIAIDLGAKSSGVYMAHYEKGVELKDLADKAKADKRAYTLTHDKLTLMMKERTAFRHQRRGYDRRQMAKRLAMLALTEGFNFDFDKHQEAISFLLNRRGRILGDDIDYEVFSQVPAQLCDIALKHNSQLGEIFQGKKDSSGDYYDLSQNITALTEKVYSSEAGKEGVRKLCDALNEYKQLKRDEKTLPKRIKATENNPSIDAKEKKESVRKLQTELEETEKRLAVYEPLAAKNINIFDFKAKYEEAIPAVSEEPDAKDKKEYSAYKAYLAYIVYSIHATLESTITNQETGHALREIYFKHLQQDLEQFKSSDQSSYAKSSDPIDRKLAYLVADIMEHKEFSTNKNQRLDKFLNILGNIANIQLRGLRKYFNSKQHQTGDAWLPDKLDRVYYAWLKSLRPEANSKSAEIINGLVSQLKSKKNKPVGKSQALALWLNTAPEYSIPPFEDQNNRRPPECRSLLLKPYKLNEALPEWREVTEGLISYYKNNSEEIYQQWLDIVAAEVNLFAEQKITYTKILKNGKSKSKKSPDKIDEQNCWGIVKKKDALLSRSLQFLLDLSRSHEENILVLRNLYEISKKHENQQLMLIKELGEYITKIHSQEIWKGFEILCRKYHEELSDSMGGRWYEENRGNLLVLCGEKTRAKKYQTDTDFAALFGLSAKQIEKLKEGHGNIPKWLYSKGIKTHCAKCAKLQKDYRNTLKERIDMAKDKKKNSFSLTDDDKELLDMDTKSEELAKALGKDIEQKLSIKLDHNNFSSVFTFAQIDNIVFADRSGNAKNCRGCSSDNQGRMQRSSLTNSALATRIRGYTARPIDGVLRKLLDAKARNIAKLKVKQLIDEKASTVTIPIITEQNRFDFEKNLSATKGKQAKTKATPPAREFAEKAERIKQAGNSICPYSGDKINQGEIDHIISRSSSKKTSQTVINSEANLIFVSGRSNRVKSKEEYRLINLHKNYRKSLFGTEEVEKIKSHIHRTLGVIEPYNQDNATPEERREMRKNIPLFNNFSNFLNLKSEEQKAFRHALFLDHIDPARRLVQDALNTSYKARVNGSQRYFASLIAQHINQMLENKKSKIKVTYDYFEIPAAEVHSLRKDLSDEIDGLKKSAVQLKYSHAIDATLVFMGINLRPELISADSDSINAIGINYERLDEKMMSADQETGEMFASGKDNYEAVAVPENNQNYSKVDVSRAKPNAGYFKHRDMHRSGTFYALKYLPVLISRDEDAPLRVGFSADEKYSAKVNSKKQAKIKYSAEVNTRQQVELLRVVLGLAEYNKTLTSIVQQANLQIAELQKFSFSDDDCAAFLAACREWLAANHQDLFNLSVKPKLASKFLVDKLNTANDDADSEAMSIFKLLMDLSYRTGKVEIKKELEKLLAKENTQKEGQYIYPEKGADTKVLSDLEKKTKLEFARKKFNMPVYDIWEELAQKIFAINQQQSRKKLSEQTPLTAANLQKEFLRKYSIFHIPSAKGPTKRKHKKVKITYSLPLKVAEGKFLQRRKSWNGNDIFQVINDADPRTGGGNAYQSPTLLPDGNKIGSAMQRPYISKNILNLSREDSAQAVQKINSARWFAVAAENIPQELKNIGVLELAYRIDDASRPSIKLKLKNSSCLWEIADKLKENDGKNSYLTYISPRNKIMDQEKLDETYRKLEESYKTKKEKAKPGDDIGERPNKKAFLQQKKDEFLDQFEKAGDNIIVTWKLGGYNKEIYEMLLPLVKKKLSS